MNFSWEHFIPFESEETYLKGIFNFRPKNVFLKIIDASKCSIESLGRAAKNKCIEYGSFGGKQV